MLISVPGNTRNNAFIFFRGIFAGPKNMTDTTSRKTDGGEGGEGFYLLGEVAESGSPFRRWVEVGAGFLKSGEMNSFHFKYTLNLRKSLNELESTNLLPTVRVLMCFGLSL